MRFSYIDGSFTTYWGYMFHGTKPVEVTDRATQDRLIKDARFRRINDEVDETQKAETEAQADAKILNPNACPKCGRVVVQGKYMHQKYCKG